VIDVTSNPEDLFPIEDAPRHLPKINGKPVSYQSVYRWVTKGCGAIRLKAVRVGRRWMTSKQALDEFCNAQANSFAQLGRELDTYVKRARSKQKRARDVAAADTECDRAGA
jgi:hypothetical protein